MTAEEIETNIKDQSQDTGIPQKELRRMCTAAGLELLEKGELKVVRKTEKSEVEEAS